MARLNKSNIFPSMTKYKISMVIQNCDKYNLIYTGNNNTIPSLIKYKISMLIQNCAKCNLILTGNNYTIPSLTKYKISIVIQNCVKYNLVEVVVVVNSDTTKRKPVLRTHTHMAVAGDTVLKYFTFISITTSLSVSIVICEQCKQINKKFIVKFKCK